MEIGNQPLNNRVGLHAREREKRGSSERRSYFDVRISGKISARQTHIFNASPTTTIFPSYTLALTLRLNFPLLRSDKNSSKNSIVSSAYTKREQREIFLSLNAAGMQFPSNH
jgi:hypothetical protein